MTIILNDPSLLPIISYARGISYFLVVSMAVVVYDWALTFGQEFELIWRQRWSLMTFLYLSVRYLAIPYAIIDILADLPSVPLTDAGCTILYLMGNWISIIVGTMLSAIIISRLYAMYQQSRQVLIFLVVTFLPIQIVRVVICALMSTGYVSNEEYVLSGAHMCGVGFQGDVLLWMELTWVLNTAWEILALCLAVCIAVKHFRELQGPSTRWTVKGTFLVIVKTHVFYFASFVAVSSLQLANLSSKFLNSTSLADEVFTGLVNSSTKVVQMFVLGPRLILAVREYNANLVANSDEGISMTSIVFQERVHLSTGNGV